MENGTVNENENGKIRMEICEDGMLVKLIRTTCGDGVATV